MSLFVRLSGSVRLFVCLSVRSYECAVCCLSVGVCVCVASRSGSLSLHFYLPLMVDERWRPFKPAGVGGARIGTLAQAQTDSQSQQRVGDSLRRVDGA